MCDTVFGLTEQHMSTPAPGTLPPLQDRYRIEERLGASRLAVVYRAYDQRLQRQVLVHLMRREYAEQAALRDRFRQEAEFGAARSHRSLLDIYDTGELAGRPFIITEFVSGRALRELGALSLEDALLYVRQVVGAVAVCQASGAPHPPISSTNIILVEDGHVELLESWQINPDDVARDLACYRPPERTAGAPLTPAGAVYSLGILLVELLSGRRPIDGDDARAVAQMHLTSSMPSLAQLQPRIYAPALEQLIQRATDRDPQQRIADAATLARALDMLHTQLSGDTQQLAVASAPSMRERVRSETSRLMRAPAVRTRLPPAMRPPDDQPPVSTAPPKSRALIGLVVVGVLFLAVACGAYNLASLAAENLTDIRLPRVDIPLPDLGFRLPDWLTGDVAGQGALLEVAISDRDGLNLRDAPGLGSNVITLLPNGSRVRFLDGPKLVDNVPWVQVRARIDNRSIEGWVSASYVRQVPSDAGR